MTRRALTEQVSLAKNGSVHTTRGHEALEDVAPAKQAPHRLIVGGGVRATADTPHTTCGYFLPPLGFGAR